MESGERFDRLREHSVGLPQVLFQAIAHMAPAAGVAFSFLIGFSFAGAAFPLSVILTLIMVLLVANSIAQLAKHIPSAGGLYTYASRSLGPKVGFLVGWFWVLAELLVAPLLFLNFAAALTDVIGTIPWWIWTIVVAGVVFAITYWGVRLSTNVSLILGILEITIIFALGLYMVFEASSANTLGTFNPANSLGGSNWSGVIKGMLFSILAFNGFETAAAFGEEARNPRRTVPLAILFSALLIGLFYVFSSYASVMGWGFGNMANYANNPDPWRTMATKFWGLGWIAIFFAILNSIVANAIAGMNVATRLIYSMGRVRVLPSIFGRTHPEHRTPYVAIFCWYASR